MELAHTHTHEPQVGHHSQDATRPNPVKLRPDHERILRPGSRELPRPRASPQANTPAGFCRPGLPGQTSGEYSGRVMSAEYSGRVLQARAPGQDLGRIIWSGYADPGTPGAPWYISGTARALLWGLFDYCIYGLKGYYGREPDPPFLESSVRVCVSGTHGQASGSSTKPPAEPEPPSEHAAPAKDRGELNKY